VELLRRYADDPVAAEIVGPDPAWDAPLRLLAGLHFLLLGGEADWDDPLEQHRGSGHFVRPRQTNESNALGFAAPPSRRPAGRVGCRSRGAEPKRRLNSCDRYSYRYEAGSEAVDAAVVEGELQPIPASSTSVGGTRACRDRQAPIDVTSEHGARCCAFVWAGQDERCGARRTIEAVRTTARLSGDYVGSCPRCWPGCLATG
jgi:hypothetical protein